MISVIDFSGESHPISDYTQYHITHREDGSDVMSFCLSTTHEQYSLLKEESIVRTDQNEYVIKKIDDDKIDCQLNFDFLKERVYRSYASETRTLLAVLTDHLPTGWTIEGANVSTIQRTIEFDVCTDYDVVFKCLKVYDVKYIWHILEKRLVIVKPELMETTGEYITSELNLTALNFRGDTTKFATRLYAYGKNGLSIAGAVIDGETYLYQYVEDKTYCDKVVCATWQDERYTVAENLYEAAVAKLATMSWPARSYSCRVIDIAKLDDRYSFLTFSMHRKIMLIDAERGVSVEHQICEYDEWPDQENLNTITLSCVQESIYTRFDETEEAIDDLSEQTQTQIEEAGSSVTQELENRLNIATAMMTSAFGSYFTNINGELFMMDNEDPAQAQVVWRWNVNGFAKSSTGIDGPYTTSLTFDDTFITSVINAMIIRGDLIEANSISAGQIKQEYTDGVTNQAVTIANGYADALFSSLNDYLTNAQGTGQLDVLVQDITDIRASINGLTLNFTEAFRGGINYLHNSAGQNGTVDWTKTGTVTTMQAADTKNYTVSNSCFRLSEDAQISQTIDDVVIENAYTISAKVKKTGALLAELYVVYNGNTVGKLFSQSAATSGWVSCEFTIDSVESGNIQIVATTRCDYLYVSDIMVCEGTTSESWTPAPDEIYTTGVMIDKRGITVYRSGTDEKTVISNEEFAGYNGEEKIFSLNGDETKIVNAIVMKMLRIEDTMMIPYVSGDLKGLNIALID